MNVHYSGTEVGLNVLMNRLLNMLQTVGAVGVLDTMLVFQQRIHQTGEYRKIMGSKEFRNLVGLILNRRAFRRIHMALKRFDTYLKTVEKDVIPVHYHWNYPEVDVELKIMYSPRGHFRGIEVAKYEDSQ